MKKYTKIGAVVLAVVMLLALSVSAFASVDSDGGWNDYNGIESGETTIAIAKSIVFVNAEETQVREPNITYTYTISTANPGEGTTIKGLDLKNDTTEMTVAVKAGPISAVTNPDKKTTVVFADTNKATATSNGTANIKRDAKFIFDNDAFTAPGIYRYKITEDSTGKASVGITEAPTYAADRYLDVYVMRDGSGYKIYGYVLFEGDETTSLDYSKNADKAKKSAGYVNTSTTAGSNADVDVYTTQNLFIIKSTAGALADKTQDFPVTINLTKASGLKDGIKLDYTVTNNGSLTKTGTDTNNVDYVTMDAALDGTVRDGSTITITGIPAGSTVTLTEKNNSTDTYRVKAGTAADGAQLLTEASVAAGATSEATTSQALSAKISIYLTNTLDTISPTGYAVRFAPYALLLACGLTLLFVTRRKSYDEA